MSDTKQRTHAITKLRQREQELMGELSEMTGRLAEVRNMLEILEGRRPGPISMVPSPDLPEAS
jgi:hypothetical protein